LSEHAGSKAKRRARLVTLIFAVCILVPSGYGFLRKLLELLALTRGEVDGSFAISPVANYLLTSVGFFFLFCWACLNGMFGDIEGPKERMLESERLLDEQEALEHDDDPEAADTPPLWSQRRWRALD
jgi:nitrogen fixation-related uncharacterized protein